MTKQSRTSSDGLDDLTDEEKAAARRASLYATHKARGTIGVFFEMYPDLAPEGYFRANPRNREGERSK
jgi:hypothetical protein